jgi:hypothetical protein
MKQQINKLSGKDQSAIYDATAAAYRLPLRDGKLYSNLAASQALDAQVRALMDIRFCKLSRAH